MGRHAYVRPSARIVAARRGHRGSARGDELIGDRRAAALRKAVQFIDLQRLDEAECPLEDSLRHRPRQRAQSELTYIQHLRGERRARRRSTLGGEPPVIARPGRARTDCHAPRTRTATRTATADGRRRKLRDSDRVAGDAAREDGATPEAAGRPECEWGSGGRRFKSSLPDPVLQIRTTRLAPARRAVLGLLP